MSVFSGGVVTYQPPKELLSNVLRYDEERANVIRVRKTCPEGWKT